MPSKSPATRPAKSAVSSIGDVGAFLATLDHPFKQEILVLRDVILGADPGIAEGIKWNAPSFRTSEYFATFHLRAKDGVQIIMHLGAKKREGAGVAVDDPQALLEWLGKDRASVRFRDMKDVEEKGAAFAAVIRQWIGYV